MSELRPPTDAEIEAMTTEYGVPVRVQVGESAAIVLGWLDESDRPNPAAAVGHMLHEYGQALQTWNPS